MSADVTPARIKGLFFHLVKSAGGVEAAGSVIGVSHQRVSILQSVNAPDMPSVLQIVALEKFVGQDIVTGPLSRAALGKPESGDEVEEAMDATEAVVDLQKTIRSGAGRREKRAALIKAEAELHDVGAALDRTEH